MKFTNRIKAEEFAISESIKRWNTYFQVHEHDDGIYTVGRYYEANSISYAIKGKLTPHAEIITQEGKRVLDDENEYEAHAEFEKRNFRNEIRYQEGYYDNDEEIRIKI